MNFNPANVSLMAFAISFKILLAHYNGVFCVEKFQLIEKLKCLKKMLLKYFYHILKHAHDWQWNRALIKSNGSVKTYYWLLIKEINDVSLLVGFNNNSRNLLFVNVLWLDSYCNANILTVLSTNFGSVLPTTFVWQWVFQQKAVLIQ